MSKQPIIERENQSGKVTCEGRRIEWHKIDGSIISIDLESVVVIGEYTTDNGPFTDDWFLVFVFKNGEWEEVSVYADGFQGVEQHLSDLFSLDFPKPFLANSTNWKSYVWFPQNLEGKELFVLTPPQRLQTAKNHSSKYESGTGAGGLWQGLGS
ncbi:hypothetical protein [Flavisolibacter tropicus]|uniref:Uncharacterized protein n=1 Tax=Flavisolibacter tropicus TaxID=1492898 RepID=A0A172TWB9_9BACT|nr:hypothetical protein [Flavisolibacter tropicus]ANE51258.1 hypothetical protein SY85_12805 [Flavisolibacter tropicus]